MLITVIPLNKITPYARNPRQNSGAPVAKVKASLKEFGWRQPIVVDRDMVIVVGHTRYAAALELGMTEAPVHIADTLTPAQIKAYRIADNRTGAEAQWDMELLGLEIQDLKELDFSLDLTGFDADELAGIELEGESEIESDTASEPRQTMAERFGIPPFSVLNAREGWWQARKQAWIAMGLQSELGRGGGAGTPPHPPTVTRNADGTLNYGGTAGQAARFDRQRQAAAPGGSARPACDYSKKQRGNGAGRAING